VGGGHWPRPREVTLAQGSVTFPANFMMVAAMNPCQTRPAGGMKLVNG
jgi:predicted ATPase with chaperone activity